MNIKLFRREDEDFEEQDMCVSVAEFFRDKYVRLKNKKPEETRPWIDAGYKYNEHGTERPCYKTRFSDNRRVSQRRGEITGYQIPQGWD